MTINLQDRASYIGASDMAAICGLSKWKTALELWREKTGRAEEKPVDSEAAELGRRFEGPILDLAIDRLGLRKRMGSGQWVERRNVRKLHPDIPYLAAEADSLITYSADDGEVWIIDAKRTGRMVDWQHEGEFRAPLYYETQFRVQMAVHDADRHFAAVLPAQPWEGFQLVETKRDIELEQLLLDDARAFWERNVQADVAPEPCNYQEASELWPTSDGKVAEASPEALELLYRLAQAKAERRDADWEIQELQRLLALMIGEREGLSHEGQTLVTWRPQKSRRIDTKAVRERFPDAAKACEKVCESRVMRLSKQLVASATQGR